MDIELSLPLRIRFSKSCAIRAQGLWQVVKCGTNSVRTKPTEYLCLNIVRLYLLADTYKKHLQAWEEALDHDH